VAGYGAEALTGGQASVRLGVNLAAGSSGLAWWPRRTIEDSTGTPLHQFLVRQFTFPNRQDSPALRPEFLLCLLIARYVSVEFWLPVFGSAARHCCSRAALVLVPKASVDEDDSSSAWQYDIGLAGEALSPKRKAIAESMQK